MRNPNGYGTVYKLSGKRRNPYIARITIGWKQISSQTIKQQYRTLGYFKTKKEALLALAKYHTENTFDLNTISLSEIYHQWSLQHYQNIQAKTKKGYETAYQKLSPYYQMPFCELKTIHFQKVIQEQSLTRSTAAILKILLNQLYQYAMKNDIVQKNYAKFIEVPKAQTKKKQIFTDVEIQKLWDSLSTMDTPYLDSILILIYTGFRIGELLALTRFHVDLEHQLIVGGGKTQAGKERIVPIHSKIAPLIERRCQQSCEKLFPISYRSYINHFKKILEQLQIQDKTPHSTRHTFATLMLRAGADKKAIQQIIGHANYTTTANIYTHLDEQDLKNAINCI